MKLTPLQIKKLKSYFAGQKDIILVYLYGSFAYGNPHKRSDIDFGILFDQPIKTYYRLGEIINDLAKLGLPAEPDARNIDLKSQPVFLNNVLRGRLIYSRDEAKRVRFTVAAMNIFRDTEHLRKLNYDYMQKRFKEGTYGFTTKYII